MDDKYAHHIRNWPFLVAQRLLKMQVSRLRMIKTALIEKLDDHPLSTANNASFSYDTIVNQRINAEVAAQGMSHMADVSHHIPYYYAGQSADTGGIPYYGEYGYGSAQAANTPQSGGASGNPSQSAIRPGYQNLGGRGQ
jgi:hypothetical protein